MKKCSPGQLHPTEYSLEGTGTESLMHHTAFAPLSTGAPGFLGVQSSPAVARGSWMQSCRAKAQSSRPRKEGE